MIEGTRLLPNFDNCMKNAAPKEEKILRSWVDSIIKTLQKPAKLRRISKFVLLGAIQKLSSA